MIYPQYFKEADFNTNPDEIIRMGFGFVKVGAGACDYFDDSVSTLAFLVDGKVKISVEGVTPIVLNAGQMAIFPTKFRHMIDILEDTIAVFLYIIGDDRTFCEQVLGSDMVDSLPADDNTIHTLHMVPPIDLFARQIAFYIGDKKFNRDISFLKQDELVTILTSYYDRAEMLHFLAPLYHTSQTFYGKVMSLSNNFLTVEEMADRLRMSRSTFTRTFKKIFGMQPKDWAIHLRATLLHKALIETDEPLNLLAQRLKFSSQQRLASFCKEQFDATPSAIRSGEVVIRPDR